MSTATSDTKVADLQRNLAATKQTCLRLEHELSAAKAAAAGQRREVERLRSAPRQRPPTPAPEPAPPPPPAPSSPVERYKQKAAAAVARADKLAADLQLSRREADDLRLKVAQFEAERASRPPENHVLREAHSKAVAALERANADLERERERRRALERRLEDALRSAKPSGAFRVPEPPPPPRQISEEEERQMAAEDEETRRKIRQLDGRLGKLEHRKESHEHQLVSQVASLRQEVTSLQRQLREARSASGGAGSAMGSARLVGAAGLAATSPRTSWARGGGHAAAVSPRGRGSARSEGGSARDHGALPPTKDPVQRLQQLDPGAAAALTERKEQMAHLRARLIHAQAESAAERTLH
jgi:hypothetical protein